MEMKGYKDFFGYGYLVCYFGIGAKQSHLVNLTHFSEGRLNSKLRTQPAALVPKVLLRDGDAGQGGRHLVP